MEEFFNVAIEPDAEKVNALIDKTIRDGGKGYVCSVEANNLSIANRRPDFRRLMNAALVNNCDGSVLALLLGKLRHRGRTVSYTGSDLFARCLSTEKFRHYFLGNTPEVLDKLRTVLAADNPRFLKMRFEALPFCRVEDFDYAGIGAAINLDNPDLIWVSLGAPKQEEFMARLLPFLQRGVMCGVGAAFNFRSGCGLRRAPLWLRRLRLEWLYRAMEEPRKNIPRYLRFLRLLPRLYVEERRKLQQHPTK
ncbi:MAG: WecB/TagA/CpsF family glycosyltransferase [Tannerella sp.]|jgi:N-acetylglucosaminyldiphosphoundecaprenol N-acetyl-beta-D-mannosaminyltransferase|nr:WecB/TagA/CpsF family glycosyltransferase [Tannerella sp.]